MATVKLTYAVRLRWWLKPYLYLTAFGLWLGLWLGLPLSQRVIERDMARGMKLELVKCPPEN